MADPSASIELGPDDIAKARVVVVDDEALVTASLHDLMSIKLDIEPRCFNEPAEALEHIKREEVDLVISDFLMPGLDGVELLRRVRALRPEVPRVLLTGYADKENAIAAINEVRLFQYLEKPWESAQLVAVITSALQYVHAMRLVAEKLEQLEAMESSMAGMRRALMRAFA